MIIEHLFLLSNHPLATPSTIVSLLKLHLIRFVLLNIFYTLPETNSKFTRPLKIGRAPKGKQYSNPPFAGAMWDSGRVNHKCFTSKLVQLPHFLLQSAIFHQLKPWFKKGIIPRYIHTLVEHPKNWCFCRCVLLFLVGGYFQVPAFAFMGCIAGFQFGLAILYVWKNNLWWNNRRKTWYQSVVKHVERNLPLWQEKHS